MALAFFLLAARSLLILVGLLPGDWAPAFGFRAGLVDLAIPALVLVGIAWRYAGRLLHARHPLNSGRAAAQVLYPSDEIADLKEKMLGSSASAFALAGFDGALFYTNPAFIKIWGFPGEEQVVGKSISELWQWPDEERSLVDQVRDNGSWTGEVTATGFNGALFSAYLGASLLPDRAGKPVCIAISVVDLTPHAKVEAKLRKAYSEIERELDRQQIENAQFHELLQQEFEERKRAEEALLDSEKRLRSIVQNAGDAIILFDSDETIIFWNQAAEMLFGFKALEITGEAFSSIITQQTHHIYQQEKDRVIVSGKTDPVGKIINVMGLKKDGSEMPLELSLSSWKTSEGIFFTAIGRDVTERKLAEDRLEFMATHDILTGLPNRTLFLDRLSHAIAQASRNRSMLAVVLLDLDGFKHINDTWGHARGDQVLQVIGSRLENTLRKSDTIARLGGDEFTVIIENVNHIDDVSIIAEKISSALSVPIEIDGQEHRVTASIGISLYPKDGEDHENLLMKADMAMYFIKERGKNNHHFYSASLSTHASGN